MPLESSFVCAGKCASVAKHVLLQESACLVGFLHEDQRFCGVLWGLRIMTLFGMTLAGWCNPQVRFPPPKVFHSVSAHHLRLCIETAKIGYCIPRNTHITSCTSAMVLFLLNLLSTCRSRSEKVAATSPWHMASLSCSSRCGDRDPTLRKVIGSQVTAPMLVCGNSLKSCSVLHDWKIIHGFLHIM